MAKPNQLLCSSRDLNWRSVLLDHHRAIGRSDVFETRATSDVTLVVAYTGRHLIQVLKHGRWHTAVYGGGNAGLTAAHDTTRMIWQALEPNDQFETLHLYLSGSVIADMAEEYRRIGTRQMDQPLSSLIFSDAMLPTVASGLLGAMRQGAPSLYAEQASRFLIGHLLARHSSFWNPEDDQRHPPLMNDRQVSRALEYMSARFRENLTLSELANEACISVHHFVRRFKECVGVTPFAHLTALRLQAAKRMLINSDMNISEVASFCGYSNAGAFASAFRREAGTTPRDYRNTMRTA